VETDVICFVQTSLFNLSLAEIAYPFIARTWCIWNLIPEIFHLKNG